MAAYRRVYDSRHLQADCQEPGSAPEPYAQKSSTGQARIQGARGPCFPSAPVRLVIRLQTSTCSQQWDSQILVSGHVPMYGPLDKILDPGLRATFTFLHIGLKIADSPTLHRQRVIPIPASLLPKQGKKMGRMERKSREWSE